MFWQYLIVALLGMLLGSAELTSRYRDEPQALLKMPASYLYIFFNALIGVAALYLLQVFPVVTAGTNGSGPDAAQIAIYNVLIAGLGGAAFFRSSIARTKVSGTEIGVGPSFVIDTFLSATDRAIDRQRALHRTKSIPDLMRPIPVAFAAESLAEYCVGAMQNFSADEEKVLNARIATILNAKLPSPSISSMLIGMTLAEYVGEDVLNQAIAKLDKEIKEAQAAQAELASMLDTDALEAAISGQGGQDLPDLEQEEADASADADADAPDQAPADNPEDSEDTSGDSDTSAFPEQRPQGGQS
ncbi:hypothetical protein E1180_19385 [Roseibium denhamense]|uniref:Uncharacterized protein n=1 Tax=Roseibium denhamense TaxID=76305 RepID=A0ABY1P3V5_9HYPH|nr:hypothetical protein [Roseibium denhamense]MTI07669.1 hypothetical protein [Roseibium denhamense]SMP24405.1 hypothetical protein SAMN06265374_2437 [Roseibium denhamense]